jgi:recombination protein RecA
MYGYEHVGKTTLAQHAVAQYQKAGGQVLWVDTEKSFDADRAAQVGCDTDAMWFSDADSIEGIFRSLEYFAIEMEKANTGKPVLAVVDSVGGSTSEWELKKKFEGESRMGLEAKTIKLGAKRLIPKVAAAHANVIFINHAYQSMAAFGSAQSSGGRGLKFMSSLRIELSGKGEIFEGKGDDKIRQGQKISVKLRKGRGSPLSHPNFSTELKVDGFDQVGSLLIAGVETGMITAEGKQYALAGETFTEELWPSFLKSIGGFDVIYPVWMAQAIESGHIKKWGINASE